jgi:hypothetical protein
VERIASDASRAGSVVGVRTSDVTNGEDAAPWARFPSGKPRSVRITGPSRIEYPRCPRSGSSPRRQTCPRRSSTRSSELRPSRIRSTTRNRASGGRRHSPPWVISCAEDLPRYVALPRGCWTDLEDLLRGLGIALDVVDERVSGEPLALTFLGTLTPVQDEAARALLANECGVLVAPPGIGKTVVGTCLVAARACNTLVAQSPRCQGRFEAVPHGRIV